MLKGSRRLLSFTVAGALSLGLSVNAASAQSMAEQWLAGEIPHGLPDPGGESISFRFTSGIPNASPVVRRFEEAVAVLGASGDHNLQSFHAGTVHRAYEAFNAARTGISDYAVCYTGPVARGFTLSQVASIPFVMPERDTVAARVLSELAPEYFAPEFENAGVYYGATIAAGHSHLLSRVPVRSLEDLEGLKIAAFGREIEFVEALGATPTPVPPFDVYTALQQGVIDGVFWTDAAFVAFSLHEVAKYLTRVGAGVVRVDGCVNRRTFDRLSETEREVIYNWSQAMAAAITQTAFADFGPIAAQILQDSGVEIIELDEAELANWRERGAEVREAWIAQAREEGLPVDELLRDIEELSAQYEGMTDDELFSLTLEEPVRGIIEGM